MKSTVFCFYDEEVGEHSNLSICSNDIVFDRSVTNFVNSPQSPYRGIEQHIVIKKIGVFDTEKGELIPQSAIIYHRLTDYLERSGDEKVSNKV